MGKEISKISQKLCMRTNFYKVLILGLEGSGKTTLFDRIKTNEVYLRHPTIGFNTEQIKLDGLSITLWDFGGHEKIMNLWEKYFDNTDLVILMIDSTDTSCYDKIKNVLNMLKEKLASVYVLIVMNKVDIKDSVPSDKISKMVDLYSYNLKIAKIIPTSTTRGDGLDEIKKTMKYVLKNNIVCNIN